MNDPMLYPDYTTADGEIATERFRMAIKVGTYQAREFRRIPGPGIPDSTEVVHTYDGYFHRLRFTSLMDPENPLWPGNKFYRISDESWTTCNADVREIVNEAYEIALKACEDYRA